MRERIRRALPAPLLSSVRQGRDRLQRLESRVRGRLPAAFGGSLRGVVTARELSAQDIDAYIALRGVASRRPGLATAFDAPDASCLGLEYGQQLVAVGWCRPAMGLAASEGLWFFADFVDARYRRRGLVQELHRQRLARAARRGVPRVYIHVDAGNPAALAALAAVGFVEVERPQWRARLLETARASGRHDRNPRIFTCETAPFAGLLPRGQS